MSLVLRLQIATWSITAAMCGVLYWSLWPHAPHTTVGAAAAVSAAFLMWSAVATVLRRRGLEPSQDTLRHWRDHGERVGLAMSVTTAVSFWLVMPYAPPTTQLFVVLLVFAATAFWLGASPRYPTAAPPSLVSRWGWAILPGMSIAYLVIHRGPMSLPLAVFMAVMTGVLVVVRDRLQRALDRLHDARQEAEAARDARTRFLAAASHDLRQPLQSARLFLGQARQGPAATRARAVANAVTALDAMDRLVQQSLDHLRLDMDDVRPRLRPVSLAGAIAQVTAQYRPVAELQGVTLRAVASRVTVRADRDLLERALGNLIDNAIRHGRPRRVLIGARRRADAARLCVLDDGAGVPEGEQGRLFEAFFQGRSAGDGERGGFGLGLANVRRFARAMGGEAGLVGGWRKGASFFIDLPRCASEGAGDRGSGDAILPGVR